MTGSDSRLSFFLILSLLPHPFSRHVAADCFTSAQDSVVHCLETEYFPDFLTSQYHAKHQVDVLTSGQVSLLKFTICFGSCSSTPASSPVPSPALPPYIRYPTLLLSGPAD